MERPGKGGMSMNIKRKQLLFALAGVCLLAGCGGEKADTEGQEMTRATVVKDLLGGTYFVDEEGTLFKIENLDSKVKEDLGAGDTVEIYGNGYIASRDPYPGVYSSVTKVTQVADGTEEDAAAYQEQLDMLYENPDPEELPKMKLEYSSETDEGPLLLEPFNFEWQHSDGMGSYGVSSHGISIFECEEIARIDLDGKTEMKLYFAGKMDSVTAVRWPSELWGTATAEEAGDGEEVALTEEEKAAAISAAESGYVYQITATRPEGYVEFAFLTE